MRKILVLMIVTIFGVLHAAAQAQPPADNPVKTGKSLVKVPVVVSDREGRRIPNLRKEHFTVFKGSEQQNISTFSTDDEPFSVALLIDTSGSTQELLGKIKEAAKDFIDLLNPGDQCMIATFDSQINILIPFNSNRQALKNSLDNIRTAEKEGSVIYSAINQTIQNSFKRTEGRKAVVVLSDGKDFGSEISRRELIGTLEESDVSIYPIYYQTGIGFNRPIVADNGTVIETKSAPAPKKVEKPKKRKNVYSVLIPLPGDTFTPEEIKMIDKTTTTDAVSGLKELSQITAGRFYLSDSENLQSIFKQVASELRLQYILGIYLEGVSGVSVFRDIRVKVDRPNAVVQSRTKLRVVANPQ